MRDRGPRALVIALIFLLPVAGGAWWIHRLSRSGRSDPPAGPARRAPLPLPAELDGTYREIQDLQGTGRFAEAAGRYEPFLRRLEAVWGADSEDLALYHYNQAVAWKLAGEKARSVETASRALARWPGSLPLRVAETTARADIASARGAFDARAHESFTALLAPDDAAALREMGVAPEALAAQWADMLLKAGRPSEALVATARGLSFAPSHRGSRELEAKTLLALHRQGEAIPILEGLLREAPSAELDLLLAVALLDRGDAEAAWRRLGPLLEGAGRDWAPGPDRHALGSSLRYQAGRALNLLRRPAEAAERLLECLLEEPENPEALHELAAAARALGAPRAAEALARRTAMLAPAETARDSEAAARRAGEIPSAMFYATRRLLVADRTGEALRSIEEAIALAPGVLELRLEEARIRLLLGRTDQAERSLRAALEATGAAACLLELARVEARDGDIPAARALLADGTARMEAGAEAAAGQGAFQLAARRARALLEMGDIEEAEKALAGGGEAAGAVAAVRLARAEIAIARGRLEEARALLEESYQEIPGGPEWARALEAACAIRGGEEGPAAARALPADPSDLLDHPHLLAGGAGAAAGAGGTDGANAWLARLREVHERRSTILRSMRGHDDAGAIQRWREICDLTTEAGARRKARELAWYIVHAGPGRAPDWSRLARALSAPEEIVARLAALERARRLAPGDGEVLRLRREARALLGLETP